jgi:hypothetical protein
LGNLGAGDLLLQAGQVFLNLFMGPRDIGFLLGQVLGPAQQHQIARGDGARIHLAADLRHQGGAGDDAADKVRGRIGFLQRVERDTGSDEHLAGQAMNAADNLARTERC